MAQIEKKERRRRKRERIIALVLLVVLASFTWVEVFLLKLSSKLPFVNSIFFFGLMNVNIVLIMLLLFLVFRNAVKLVLDERRGKFGSKLRTRLVFSFTLYAIIPSVFLFSISAIYIKSSFDKWSNIKVGGTLQKSIDVVRTYYENTERNGAHFAKKIAATLSPEDLTDDLLFKKLQAARLEYGLDAIEYHRDPAASRIITVTQEKAALIPSASLESLQKAFQGQNECRVHNVGEGELVRCSSYLGIGKGVIFADYFIPIALASQLSEINLTYSDYKTDNPLNYPIKSTYFTILSMVTLLILFTATWTGFYVAKRLTGPIEDLLKGTEAVAKGDLEHLIPKSGGDELGKLIDSFNSMTSDLKQNKKDIEETHSNLKKINEELNHRRRYTEVLLESVQSGVLSLDEHGRISTINQAAIELLRITENEDVIGKPYWFILPEEHRAEFRDLLLTVFGTAKPVRRELRFKIPGNEWLSLLLTLSVLRDESKKQMGVVAVFEDVSEIQKMERMMAWREVAKRIAHEIKNPLTPIQLSVQRLRRRYLDKIQDDGTFGQSTEIILSEVDALKKLVGEFTTFSRLPEIKQMPEDLNEVILEASNLFRAAHENIIFVLSLTDGLGKIALDKGQFKRALVNLFDNAVAAMEGKGKITVTTEMDKGKSLIRLSVADEGCGIDEKALSQLFEPYFSTKQGGTGLGLAIVQRIVADHGGSVRVTANIPHGTKFLIEFPETVKVAVREPELNA